MSSVRFLSCQVSIVCFYPYCSNCLLYVNVVVRLLREELQLLQEQESYVGEVVKPMDKKKVLVKVCLTFN